MLLLSVVYSKVVSALLPLRELSVGLPADTNGFLEKLYNKTGDANYQLSQFQSNYSALHPMLTYNIPDLSTPGFPGVWSNNLNLTYFGALIRWVMFAPCSVFHWHAASMARSLAERSVLGHWWAVSTVQLADHKALPFTLRPALAGIRHAGKACHRAWHRRSVSFYWQLDAEADCMADQTQAQSLVQPVGGLQHPAPDC